MPDETLFRLLAKHRQARAHLEALIGAMRAFLDDTPCRTEGRLSDDNLEFTFTVHDIKPVPENISLMVGDVLHNCRACLDHLAWAISQRPGRTTQFPICDSPPEGGPQIAGGISSAHQDALIAAQPYTISPQIPENALLAILRDLDNTDKHRLLLTSVTAMHANQHGNASGYRGSPPEPEYHWGELREGRAVVTFTASEPSPDMHVSSFEITPSVALANIGRDNDEVDARELLWEIHKLVGEVVQAFAPI